MSNSGFASARSVIPEKLRALQGPILVLGASGFVGANLLRLIAEVRHDVFGTSTRLPAWRLEGLPRNQLRAVDLVVDSNLDQLLDSIRHGLFSTASPMGAPIHLTDQGLISHNRSSKQRWSRCWTRCFTPIFTGIARGSRHRKQ